MKFALVLLSLMISLPGSALPTADCPAETALSYSMLIPVSEQRIERLKRNPNPAVYRYAKQARQALIAAPAAELKGIDYKFKEGDRGSCFYSNSQSEVAALQIYSRAGSHFMRVTLPVFELPVYTVHELAYVGTDGLTAEFVPTTPVMLKIGGSAYQIGWAYSLEIKP